MSEAFLLEEEVVVEGEPDAPLELVEVVFAKELAVDPLVEIQQLLPNFEELLPHE